MKNYSIKEIEEALSTKQDIQELKDIVERQKREIKSLEDVILYLEKSIVVQDSIALAREFEQNPQLFLDRPFSTYINSPYLRARYFQDWFIELVNNFQVKSFSELLEIPESNLRRAKGIGTTKVNAIKEFTRIMLTNGHGIRAVRSFTGSNGGLRRYYFHR